MAPLGRGGLNFGWPCFEGTLPFDATATCVDPVAPIWEQAHDDGSCSVIGGVVIRDPRLPTLAGRFLFGDYCTGLLSSSRSGASGAPPVTAERLDLAVPELSSFGVDGLARVYAMSTDGEGLPPRPGRRSESPVAQPRDRPQPHPDRRQQHVERADRNDQRREPDHPVAQRNPPLLGEVTADTDGEAAVLAVRARSCVAGARADRRRA